MMESIGLPKSTRPHTYARYPCPLPSYHTHSPFVVLAQYTMFYQAFNSVPGCSQIPLPDFTFPSKALDKLRVDIVPTPNAQMYVVIAKNLFPLLDLLQDLVGIKAEDVGQSGFDGYPLMSANLEQAVQIMEHWGWKTTIYDEVQD